MYVSFERNLVTGATLVSLVAMRKINLVAASITAKTYFLPRATPIERCYLDGRRVACERGPLAFESGATFLPAYLLVSYKIDNVPRM